MGIKVGNLEFINVKELFITVAKIIVKIYGQAAKTVIAFIQ